MFTTYRVSPLRRSGLGEGVRPINALLAEARQILNRVAASFTGHATKTHAERGSKLITAS